MSVTLVLVAYLAMAAAPDSAAAPTSANLPSSLVRMAERCRRMAIADENERADTAFRKHAATYIPRLRPNRDGSHYIRIDFFPPEEKRDYEVGFTCLFEDRLDPDPSIMYLETMTWTRPPVSELSERCTAGAAKAWRDPGFPKRLLSYAEKDSLAGDNGQATIDFTPPGPARRAWPRLSCRLAPPYWAPEVSFYPSANGGAAASAAPPSR